MLTRILIRTAQMVAIVGICLTVANGAQAAGETWTAWGVITQLEAGWGADVMSVAHSAPIVNPGGCSVTTYGYATAPDDPGHSLYHTVALTAFMNKKEVALLIAGCAYNKPKIIAVKIR